MSFGSKMRECRLEQGMSLRMLSEKLNVSESTVLRYETGAIRNLSETTMAIIADALGVPVSYLLGEQDVIKPEDKTKAVKLTNTEQILISCYRSISDSDRSAIRALLLSMNSNYAKLQEFERRLDTAERYIADCGEDKDYRLMLEEESNG